MINLIKKTSQLLTVKQAEIIAKLTERLEDCDYLFTPQEIEQAYLKSEYLDRFVDELANILDKNEVTLPTDLDAQNYLKDWLYWFNAYAYPYEELQEKIIQLDYFNNTDEQTLADIAYRLKVADDIYDLFYSNAYEWLGSDYADSKENK